MSKPLLKEMAWLLLAVVTTLGLAVAQFGWGFTSQTVDVHLYDTYFLISPVIVLIPMFLIICFMLFFVKEINHRFSRTIPSVIIMASGILLIGVLTKTTQLTSDIPGFANFIIVMQVILMVMTIYAGYRLGVSKKKT